MLLGISKFHGLSETCTILATIVSQTSNLLESRMFVYRKSTAKVAGCGSGYHDRFVAFLG